MFVSETLRRAFVAVRNFGLQAADEAKTAEVRYSDWERRREHALGAIHQAVEMEHFGVPHHPKLATANLLRWDVENAYKNTDVALMLDIEKQIAQFVMKGML